MVDRYRTEGSKLASLITLVLSRGCDHLSVYLGIKMWPRLSSMQQTYPDMPENTHPGP